MTRVGWRWWLLPGVAHETRRMVYEPPLTRLRQRLIDAADRLARMFTHAFPISNRSKDLN
jgi:hypothetical protein